MDLKCILVCGKPFSNFIIHKEDRDQFTSLRNHLKFIESILPGIAEEHTNQATHKTEIRINEEHFRKCLSAMQRIKEDRHTLEQFCRKLATIDESDLKNPYYAPLLADLGKFLDYMIYTYKVPSSKLSMEISPSAIANNCKILKKALA